jgi:hypothetical protein
VECAVRKPPKEEEFMNTHHQNQNAREMDVEVLYQKLGDRWFAFSIIGDEVFMAPISEDQIQSIRRGEGSPNRPMDHEAA